jgi:hypothetical protein
MHTSVMCFSSLLHPILIFNPYPLFSWLRQTSFHDLQYFKDTNNDLTNLTFMWPRTAIWCSCDHAPRYDVHVTAHRDMTFTWPCTAIWRSRDRDMTFTWPRYDVHVTAHRDKFLIIKPTRCTNFSNLFLIWNLTCFGQFLCPSSGVFHCTHSNGICHTGLLTACDIFRTCPVWLWGPPSLLYNGYRVFPGSKAAGTWRWPPTLIYCRG